MRRQRNIEADDALTSEHIVFPAEPSAPFEKKEKKKKNQNQNKTSLESLSQIAGKAYGGEKKKGEKESPKLSHL